MGTLLVILPFLGFALLIVVIWIIARHFERRRTEAMQQLAVSMGFLFETEGDVAQLRALADLALFNAGHSKTARNVLSGRDGDRDVKLLDYRYTVGSGKHSRRFEQTVALYPGAAPGLPDLTLAPENVFHKIGQKFGYQDINFDSYPTFSSCYLLRGDNEMSIRAAFASDVLAFFEGQVGWNVEIKSGSVAVYRSGKTLRPEELQVFREQTRAVVRALTRR